MQFIKIMNPKSFVFNFWGSLQFFDFVQNYQKFAKIILPSVGS